MTVSTSPVVSPVVVVVEATSAWMTHQSPKGPVDGPVMEPVTAFGEPAVQVKMSTGAPARVAYFPVVSWASMATVKSEKVAVTRGFGSGRGRF